MSHLRFPYVCCDCKARFTLSSAERNSANRPRCSACGSYYFEPAPGDGYKSALDDLTRATPQRRPYKTPTSRHARREKLLSSPTNYRLATLRNRHKQLHAKDA